MVFVVLTVYKNSLGFTGRLQDGGGVVKKKVDKNIYTFYR